jgi:hypothetical protein
VSDIIKMMAEGYAKTEKSSDKLTEAETLISELTKLLTELGIEGADK